MESSKLLLEKALMLKPQDRFMLIEGLIKSLSETDKGIDQIWTADVEKILKACNCRKLNDIKADFKNSHKSFKPFKVRKFRLGKEIHVDRDELYAERGL